MNAAFYVCGLIAVFCTVMVIISANVVHALLYLIISLCSVAVIFLLLGAPLAAAMEIVVYAGAIMVLFVFVIMMLNLGGRYRLQESLRLSPEKCIGPAVTALILLVQLIHVLTSGEVGASGSTEVGPKAVSVALYGPYLIGVELASLLLLAGLVGAYHLGTGLRRPAKKDS